MLEQRYRITGMSCAACSASVERVTRKLEGVMESEVNLTTEIMRIIYDENVVGEEQIIAKVNKAGFGCELLVETPIVNERQEKREKEQEEAQKILRVKKQRLIVTMLFAVLLLYVSMGHMLPNPLPVPEIMSMHAYPVNFALTQLLLTIPVLVLNYELFLSGVKSIQLCFPKASLK